MKISSIKVSTISNHDRLVDFLNSLPNDEVLSTTQLEQQVGFSIRTGSIDTSSEIKEYQQGGIVVNGQRTKLWGNKKAIAALRKKINENK